MQPVNVARLGRRLGPAIGAAVVGVVQSHLRLICSVAVHIDEVLFGALARL